MSYIIIPSQSSVDSIKDMLDIQLHPKKLTLSSTMVEFACKGMDSSLPLPRNDGDDSFFFLESVAFKDWVTIVDSFVESMGFSNIMSKLFLVCFRCTQATMWIVCLCTDKK